MYAFGFPCLSSFIEAQGPCYAIIGGHFLELGSYFKCGTDIDFIIYPVHQVWLYSFYKIIKNHDLLNSRVYPPCIHSKDRLWQTGGKESDFQSRPRKVGENIDISSFSLYMSVPDADRRL